jgi:hypothetical protein
MLGHLFEPDEELIQYRTFYYREHGSSCFSLQSGEDDKPQVEKKARASLTAPTTGPKKKINFQDYKKKQANGVITPGKKISPELAPTKLPQPHVNGVKEQPKETPPKPAPKPDESQPRKRKLEDSVASKPSKQADAPSQDNMQPAKKARKDSLSEPNTTLEPAATSNGTPHGLPPILSPNHAPLNPYDLPPILSPTLPVAIKAELKILDGLETQRKRAESSASTSSSDKKSQLLAVPDANAPRSDKASKGSPQPRNKVKPVSNAKSPSAEPAQLHREMEQVMPEKRSRIVRLKYGKKVARTLEQLLKLPASRKPPTAAEKRERQENMKDRLSKPQPKSGDVEVRKNKEASKAPVRNSTSTAKAEANATSKAPEKRPRAEDDMPSSKRQRTQASRENPSTPTPQPISPPTKSNKSSAQKPQGVYSTPRKVIGAINMIRTSSGEGIDSTVTTPSSGMKNYDAKVAPTSTPVNGKKQVAKHPLQQISMKLNSLGRSLKHECQGILNKGKPISEEDSKRAAVIFLECILSYMAGYYVQDVFRVRPGEVDNTWKTLLPFSLSFAACTRNFKHLEGLRLYLSVIMASCVSGAVSLRYRPLAHDSPQDQAPPSDTAANIAVLSDHFIKVLRFAAEARQALPIDDIMTSYPQTWAGRETIANPSKDGGKIVGDTLAGPYFLPIGIDTSPIHAVRFGLQFLKEYCAKERLKYEFRVNLENAE